MVLLLLAVSATIVGALCREAMLAQSAAAAAQADLQLRWGRESCQTALLPAADNIMDRARLAGAPASDIVWQNIDLGGQSMQLGFGDEQARINLNAVYAASGKDGVRQALQTLGRNSQTMPRLILGPEPTGEHIQRFALLPLASDESNASDDGQEPTAVAVIGSLGQLFPDATASQLSAASLDVTCWGDGRVNLHRAPAEVIAQAAGALLLPQQVKQIVAARDRQIDMPLQNLLALTGADSADRLAQKFTDDSFCHSLWIVTQVGQCPQYRLAVRDASDSRRVHSAIFDW
jgi:type II secretory pathway component PulK